MVRVQSFLRGSLVRSQATARGAAAVRLQSFLRGRLVRSGAVEREAALRRVQSIFRGSVKRSGQLAFHTVDYLSSFLGSTTMPYSMYPLASELWCMQNTGKMPWRPGSLIVMPQKEYHIPSWLAKSVQLGDKVLVGASSRWQPSSAVLKPHLSYFVLTTKARYGKAVLFYPCAAETRAAAEKIVHAPAAPRDVRSTPSHPAQVAGAPHGLLFYLDSCTLKQVTSEPCYGYYGILAPLKDTDLGFFDLDCPSKKSMAGIKVAEPQLKLVVVLHGFCNASK